MFPEFNEFLKKEKNICVVGLGYVGLPLAAILSRKFSVIGFDINRKRIDELKKGIDTTGEVENIKDLNIHFTYEPSNIRKANLIIITVPTPIDKHKIPDLNPVKSATRTVGRNLSPFSIIVYESTVYPGVTEEICVPILEKESGLKYLEEFKVGYSPERVNPGDKEHTIDRIVKVVSGCDSYTLNLLSEIYGSVIRAGIHKAPNIKTAEAAKVIENTQRDLNIALMNELSVIFHKMGLDTKDVLEAAGTKWNFLKFEPGLVGGHCIGVDPYYLTFKAQEIGYHPEVILAGRRINDSMGKYIAEQTVKLIIKENKKVLNSKIAILGFTFKENIKDIRNTKVIDIYRELKDFGAKPFIYDPHAEAKEVQEIYGIKMLKSIEQEAPYDAIVVAVKHKEFLNLSPSFFSRLSKGNPIIIDVKGIYDRKLFTGARLWRL
jgi:UDP-N-acetyl-D-galactosamine dehydrogenase